MDNESQVTLLVDNNFYSLFLEPSEENINLLMEMGFTRERVVQALRETNNDVQLATVILLQQ